jgi:hypothetical protein
VSRRLLLPTLPPADADGEQLAEFELCWDDALRLWKMVLAMSVRDAASSLHYHPWKPSGGLWYVVKRVRWALVPPPNVMARPLALAAGSLLSGRVGAVLRRRFGWPLRTSGWLRVDSEFGPATFAGVVWETGGVFGVEWHRLEPSVTHAEQDDLGGRTPSTVGGRTPRCTRTRPSVLFAFAHSAVAGGAAGPVSSGVRVRHEGVAGTVLLFREEVPTPAVLPAVCSRGMRPG